MDTERKPDCEESHLCSSVQERPLVPLGCHGLGKQSLLDNPEQCSGLWWWSTGSWSLHWVPPSWIPSQRSQSLPATAPNTVHEKWLWSLCCLISETHIRRYWWIQGTLFSSIIMFVLINLLFRGGETMTIWETCSRWVRYWGSGPEWLLWSGIRVLQLLCSLTWASVEMRCH